MVEGQEEKCDIYSELKLKLQYFYDALKYFDCTCDNPEFKVTVSLRIIITLL
jgi:hypothetical protein